MDPSAVIAVLIEPFTDPASRTWWPALGVAAFVALGLARASADGVRAELRRWTHPSSRLDLQLLTGRQLLRLAGLLPELVGAYWIATRLVMFLDRGLGRPDWTAPGC